MRLISGMAQSWYGQQHASARCCPTLLPGLHSRGWPLAVAGMGFSSPQSRLSQQVLLMMHMRLHTVTLNDHS